MTGSNSMIEVGGQKFLVDCGLHQGSPEIEKRNSEPLGYDHKAIAAVFVTHAHLDHVGRLPLLTKNGFAGKIYATKPTVELAQLILDDALNVMTYNNRKLKTPILYAESDIASVMSMFVGVEYGEEIVIPAKAGILKSRELDSRLRGNDTSGEVVVKFHDAGHIFGSAFIEIAGEGKRIVFSGDVGNVEVPILRDTEKLPGGLDALICESTYGNRLHESVHERQEVIENMIREGIERGGVVMIPSFSLERTQELLYELNDLIDRKKKLPRVPIFLDSPLAIDAIKVYEKYPEYYDAEAAKYFKAGDDLFNFPGLTLTHLREESMKINHTPGCKIIIAGAGMMNGGRIVFHALRYLSDPKNTLLIIGYQSAGTLGRKIVDGQRFVDILGERVEVRCKVKMVGALSAHGDQDKLLDWIGGGATTPKKVYLNHGDPVASEALAKRITEDLGVKATVVNVGLEVRV